MTEVVEKNVTEEENNIGPKWGRILVWGGLLVLLTVVALGLQRTQEGPVGPGQAAPAFVLTTFDGQEIDSADLAGKVVVLNFWLLGANHANKKPPI